MKFDSLLYQYFRQIQAVGITITICRDPSVVNQETGAIDDDERMKDYTTKGIITTVSAEFWPHETVVTGKQQILISAKPFAERPTFIPQVGDTVDAEGVHYKVLGIQAIRPAGKTLAYRLLAAT